jgi:uncharacterized protein (TIGR02231 family)
MNALFIALALAANGPNPTPVVRAVVYPDRAQVVRRGALACGPRAKLLFAELPPAADPASFRASSDSGTVEGLRVESHPQTTAYAPQVAELDEKLRKLTQAQAALHDQRRRAEAREQSAAAYGEVATTLISREMVDGPPSTSTWGSALDQDLDARLKAGQEQVKVDAQLRTLQQQLDAVRATRAQLDAAASRSALSAEVLVSCPSGRTAQVELSYMVGGAGWEPAYEARAEEGSDRVELTTFATVHQATGEPWTHAQLALSTSIPRQSATPPELQPLKVYATERGDERKVLVRRDEEVKHAELSGAAEKSFKKNGTGLVAADQGLSVQLNVPSAADVPGDGTASRLLVARTPLPAVFAFRTAPKLAPFVFRVADVTNTGAFPLLPGPVDAFRAHGFTGRYALERVAVGAPFHLTFGIDESLKVKRTVVTEISRQTGLFGGNQRFSFAYRFEVANFQSGPRRIELAEHVPVSELDDVKVELESKTTAGFELRRDDGIATWKLDLAPGASKTVDLAFHVDVPSSYDTSGL